MNPQRIWQLFEGNYLDNPRCRYRRLRFLRYVVGAFEVCVRCEGSYEFIKERLADLKMMVGEEKKGLQGKRMAEVFERLEKAMGELETALGTGAGSSGG